MAPKRECSENPFTLFALTADGSHCSHLSGIWPFGQSWLDHVVGEWFSAILALADTAKDNDLSDSEHSQSEELGSEAPLADGEGASTSTRAGIATMPPRMEKQHSTAGLRYLYL